MNTIQPTYEIRIRGHLEPNRLQRFEHLTINPLPNGETVLLLPDLDQARLFGTLLQIRDLGIPLLSVNRKGLQTDEPRNVIEKG